MSAVVLKAGLLDTLQDGGRYGHQHLGINPCGVMDSLSANVANILAGNHAMAVVLEVHFPAASLQFTTPRLIALSGADFGATINGEAIPGNTAIIVNGGAVLKFTASVQGARCYIAIRGGWSAEEWLGSGSTNLKVKKGGYHGRSLQNGDEIKNRTTEKQMKIPMVVGSKGYVALPISANTSPLYTQRNFRCIAASEYDWLDAESRQRLVDSSFTINNRSDRMGYQLSGSSLVVENKEQLLSSAVTKGTIQCLPSGQLIVLMADHQTTGGYPRIANVISADLPSLAQMKPGSLLNLRLVDVQTAEDIFFEQQYLLEQIRVAVLKKFKQQNLL